MERVIQKFENEKFDQIYYKVSHTFDNRFRDCYPFGNIQKRIKIKANYSFMSENEQMSLLINQGFLKEQQEAFQKLLTK